MDYSAIENQHFSTLLRQRETIQNIPRRQRDILSAVNRVTDRRRGVVAAGLIVPEILPGLRIERNDVAVARRGKQQAAGGGQHAVRQGALEYLEDPDRFSCFR